MGSLSLLAFSLKFRAKKSSAVLERGLGEETPRAEVPPSPSTVEKAVREESLGLSPIIPTPGVTPYRAGIRGRSGCYFSPLFPKVSDHPPLRV